MIRTVQLPHNSCIQFTDEQEDADFVITLTRVTNFLTLPQRICQFPYEGGFVRKDLLPLTVRTYCSTDWEKPPRWWLPCFDLSTEFHHFRHEYLQRSELDVNNFWIVKPCIGTQARGHRIFSIESGLEEIAQYVTRLHIEQDADDPRGFVIKTDKVDSIAQLLVTSPLCVLGRKFDIRAYVFVRSFEPFEGI